MQAHGFLDNGTHVGQEGASFLVADWTAELTLCVNGIEFCDHLLTGHWVAAQEVGDGPQSDGCGVRAGENVGAEMDHDVTGVHFIGSEDFTYAHRESMSRPSTSALMSSPSRLRLAREFIAFSVNSTTWFQVSMAGMIAVKTGVAEQVFMILRDLSAECGVGEHSLDGFHHAIDIGAALEEAELGCECDFTDDIECEVLKPGA